MPNPDWEPVEGILPIPIDKVPEAVLKAIYKYHTVSPRSLSNEERAAIMGFFDYLSTHFGVTLYQFAKWSGISITTLARWKTLYLGTGVSANEASEEGHSEEREEGGSTNEGGGEGRGVKLKHETSKKVEEVMRRKMVKFAEKLAEEELREAMEIYVVARQYRHHAAAFGKSLTQFVTEALEFYAKQYPEYVALKESYKVARASLTEAFALLVKCAESSKLMDKLRDVLLVDGYFTGGALLGKLLERGDAQWVLTK